jgi:pSer/pThr/pTyr-binding forkhead associated (FHA) protein
VSGSGNVLVWMKHDGDRREFPITAASMVVGRDPEADIRIDEPLVSRAHARLEARGGAIYVVDLGSTNLTRVNGEVVAERELCDKDELQFARARCVFVSSEKGPSASEA